MKQLMSISNLLIQKKNNNDSLVIKNGIFKHKHAINIPPGYKFKQIIPLISELNTFTIECWVNIVNDSNETVHPLIELWSDNTCVFHVEYCPFRQHVHVNNIEFYPKNEGLYGINNEWHYLSIVFDNGNIKRYWDCKYQSEMTIDIPKNINSIRIGNVNLYNHGTNSEYYKDIAIDDLILVTNNTEISTELPTNYKGDSTCVFLDINNYIFGCDNN